MNLPPSSVPLQRAQKPMMNSSNEINTNNKKLRFLFEIRVQARVRAGHDLSSEHVTDLPEGSLVVVEEIISNRARIVRPIHGWVSAFSKYGQQIIMQVNEETEKIGGKAILTQQIKTEDNTYKCIETECAIVDYNQGYNMHKIQSKDGNQRWISLKDPNVRYISKYAQKQSNLANVYRSKRTEAFFEQCFSADYPQFASKNRVKLITKDMNQMDEEMNDDNKHIKENEETNRCNKENELNVMVQKEFIKKMKVIEKKIIEHLHIRGYFEDNPEFWKYIAKAKEIAIAKVQKEKEKYLETQMFQGQPRNNCVY